MNTTVIEAQARYLIEDRIHPTHRQQCPTSYVVGTGRCAA